MSIFRRLIQTITLAIVTLTVSAVVVSTTLAATITGVNDYPTTLQSSQAANHTLVFTTPTGASLGSTITLSFSTSFDTSTITEDDVDVADDGIDLTTASTCAGTEQASVSVASDVVTITICAGDGGAIAAASQITIEIGTHATASGTGANRITNPTSTGTYFVTVAGTFGDDGSVAFPISGDDSVSVTATVPTRSSGTGTGSGSAASTDTTAPTISSILVTSLSETSVAITWTTDEASTSSVSYGETISAGDATSSDSSSTTSHSLTLTGLTPGETYYFAVSSTDGSGNEATSSIQTFTTLDETEPVISGVEVVDITTTTARVIWTTDEAADSRVSYGQTTTYGSTEFDSSLVTSHSITLTDLTSGTTYDFQVLSSDFSENQSYTDNNTFETDHDDAPVNVSNLTADDGNQTSTLTWKNPDDEDLAGVLILVCADEYPDGPTDEDCTAIDAGLAQSSILSHLTNGADYFIGVFAYDGAGQFASGALVTASPSAPEEEVPSVPLEEEPGEEQPGDEGVPVSEQETGEEIGTGGEVEEPTALGAAEGIFTDTDVSYFVEDKSLELTTTTSGVVEVLPSSIVLITIPASEISEDVDSVYMTIDGDTYLMSLDEISALYEAEVTITDTGGVYTLTVTVTSGDGSAEVVSSYLYVINPGDVYQVIDGEEAAVAHATVTLFEVVNGALIVWDGSPYDQDNPTTTRTDGTFAWYVPSGTYVVQAQAQGFETAQTDELRITDAIVNPRILLLALEQEEEEGTQELPSEGETTSFNQGIGSMVQNVLSLRSAVIVQEFLGRIRDLPGVERTAEISTPVLAVAAGASLVVLSVAFDFLPFLQFIFTAPILFFARRKRKGYGVVYNAIGKTPIDLAVVRLYALSHDEEATSSSGRLLQSRVTDKGGRYFFLVPSGRYRLTVTKAGFEFPSMYLKDEQTDGQYLDVYHSEVIEVSTTDVVITANIPMDPSQAAGYQAPSSVMWRKRLRALQHSVAVVGIMAAIIFAVIRPTAFSVGMVVVQIAVYLLVRRLVRVYKPIRWGMVYARETGRPLSSVVARVFEPKYNKLLETQVTDSKGRYAFLLGPNEYFAVFEKEGFEQKEIKPIDYSARNEPANFSETVALETMHESDAKSQ